MKKRVKLNSKNKKKDDLPIPSPNNKVFDFQSKPGRDALKAYIMELVRNNARTEKVREANAQLFNSNSSENISMGKKSKKKKRSEPKMSSIEGGNSENSDRVKVNGVDNKVNTSEDVKKGGKTAKKMQRNVSFNLANNNTLRIPPIDKSDNFNWLVSEVNPEKGFLDVSYEEMMDASCHQQD